ncbi:MAG: preQ(1) synthase [Duncaniella sp.]|nr:preQ(1) synthase [Duncaniella sp.]
MRTAEQLEGVTLLGESATRYADQYAPEVLETFPNKHPENEYLVTFLCPEFTSLCPKTGQPDFAKILISYIPRERMVESKSLKLYLFSFRNHGDFHEDCVNIIMKDLVRLMDPKYLEVKGIFTPRGGIAIHPFANYGDADHQDMVRTRLLNSFRDEF